MTGSILNILCAGKPGIESKGINLKSLNKVSGPCEMLLNDLYTVEQSEAGKTGNGFSVLVRLNPFHEIFSGHFPGNPVLPGVCFIQILKEILMDQLGAGLVLNNFGSIKFFSVVNPGANGSLHFDIALKETGSAGTSFNAVIYFESVIFCRLKGDFRLNLPGSNGTSA